MIKLMKYLKKSAGALVLIVGLLFLQAYCDLSLPDYTSKIINVGIQQHGIEDGVPEKIRTETLDSLKIFMSEKDVQTVSKAYETKQETYVLKDGISEEERKELNDIFSMPMMMVGAFASDSETGEAMIQKMGLPEGTDPVQALAALPEEAVSDMLGEMKEQLKDMPESIMTQASVAFVYSEYREMGEDTDALYCSFRSENAGNGVRNHAGGNLRDLPFSKGGSHTGTRFEKLHLPQGYELFQQ